MVFTFKQAYVDKKTCGERSTTKKKSKDVSSIVRNVPLAIERKEQKSVTRHLACPALIYYARCDPSEE